MLLVVAVLAAVMAIGMPLYVAFFAAGLVAIGVVADIPVIMTINATFDSLNKFTLVAVPFFLFSGALIEKTSMASRLIEWLFSIAGRIKGGAGIVCLAANEFFGAISGSSIAAVGTVGRMTHPYVAEAEGESFSLGLLTTAGALAIIMPPSITMILFAAVTNISCGELFLAGAIPAILIGLLVGGYIVWRSTSVSKEPFRWKKLAQRTRDSFWVLMYPVIVLGGIYLGWFTPTEAACVAAFYGLFVGWFIYKELTWQVVWEALVETLQLTARVFIIVSASAVFSQGLTLIGLPQALAETSRGLNPIMFFVVLNIALLIAGMFIEPVSIVVVMAPIVAPIASQLGISLIHLGIVFTVNIAIGMFTPPFGLNLFVAQSVFGKSMEEVVRSIKPFWVWYVLALLIVTYIPGLYLWLPKALGF